MQKLSIMFFLAFISLLWSNSAGALTSPCIARVLPTGPKADFDKLVTDRFNDKSVYAKVTSWPPSANWPNIFFSKHFDRRMVVCVLDESATADDVTAIEKIPAYGGEMYILKPQKLTFTEPHSDELGLNSSQAAYMITAYAEHEAEKAFPIPRGADGCEGACERARDKYAADIVGEMLPTLKPARLQVIHTFDFDDAAGNPNPEGVLAFINEVMLSVEAMRGDRAYKTFDQKLGSSTSQIFASYYYPLLSYPSVGYTPERPAYVASTLQQLFDRMVTASHGKEEAIADLWVTALGKPATFKSVSRASLPRIQSPEDPPLKTTFNQAIWLAQCTSSARDDINSAWGAFGGLDEVVYLSAVSQRYCVRAGKSDTFDMFDELRVDSKAVNALEELNAVAIGRRTDNALLRLQQIMIVNTVAVLDIDSFTGRRFFDDKIQMLQARLDSLKEKANDNIMNHLGQVVQMGVAIYSLYTGVGELQALYAGVNGAFANAPAGQSAIDTLVGFGQSHSKEIGAAAQDMEKGYAGVEAGIQLVRALNTSEATGKADELEQQLIAVRQAYSEFLRSVQENRSFIANAAKVSLDELSLLRMEEQQFPLEVLNQTVDVAARATFGTALAGTSPAVLQACLVARRNFGLTGTAASAVNIVSKCEPFESTIRSYFACAQARPASGNATVVDWGDMRFVVNRINFADKTCVH